MKNINKFLFFVLAFVLLFTNAMAAKTGDNFFKIGPTTGTDVEIRMGEGRLKWDSGTSKMVISNDSGASDVNLGEGGAPDSNAKINLGITASVAVSALTVDLTQADGSSDPSAASPVNISFRNSDITNGGFDSVSAQAALTIVVPSGATLGTISAAESQVYVYAIDNAGVIELAVSLTFFPDETDLISTTLLDASSDSSFVIYSVVARASVPFRYLGRVLSTQATAGTWVTTPSKLFSGDTPEFQTCRVIDEKANGVNGGTATSGSFQIKDLTVLQDVSDGGCSFVTLSTNVITTYGGTFRITDSQSPSGTTNNQSCRFRNTSDAITSIIGDSRQSTSSTTVQINCTFNGAFTESAQKNHEVQHWISTTAATTGWGTAGPGGEVEIYTTFFITKEK